MAKVRFPIQTEYLREIGPLVSEVSFFFEKGAYFSEKSSWEIAGLDFDAKRSAYKSTFASKSVMTP